MRVLAIDPGQKSGVCLYAPDGDVKINISEIVPDGLAGIRNWWDWRASVIEPAILSGELILVVESFEAEEGTHGIDYEPLEIIGWLKALDIPIVWQRRMQRGKDKLIGTKVLKRAGLYPKRGELKEGHQVAALQHALAYLVRQRHLPTLRLLHPQEEL